VPVFDVDVVILGGGLHGGLTALALSKLDRPPRVLLIEASERLAGNQVWSCHTTDVGDDRDLLDALATVRWPSYDVRFPNVERTIALEYRSMHASKFAPLIHDAIRNVGFNVLLETLAEIADQHHVQLSDGKTVSAEWIIDARGLSKNGVESPVGWQKFLGVEIECEQSHGLKRPCVMDAVSTPQRDGYRFVYTLPFAPNTTLIEETFYSDDPAVDVAASRETILEYAGKRSWRVKGILREELGALPIPYGRSGRPKVEESPAPTQIGWRGGWFHPTTGYSFGLGVQVAAAIARSWEDSYGRHRMELQSLAVRVRRQGSHARRLNRLLFTAFAPEDRMHVLERFHRVLSDDAIGRFYALTMTRRDECRLLVGRPPKGFSGGRWLAHWWAGASR
jgi:lycopene beta-cyclase